MTLQRFSYSHVNMFTKTGKHRATIHDSNSQVTRSCSDPKKAALIGSASRTTWRIARSSNSAHLSGEVAAVQ